MELDHLFILTTPDAPEVAKLEAIGLTPTYRREHVGQGTANVCYCFDNAYLELLWITSAEEAQGAAIARMQLVARAQWRTAHTNPFGIAWRPTVRGSDAPSTWPYTPPYLPAGVAIGVASDSDHLDQPMMFTFPGSQAPRDWPGARRGALQAPGGFTRLDLAAVWLPPHVRPSATLVQIAASTGASIGVRADGCHGFDVTLTRAAAGQGLRLELPGCSISR